MYILWLMLRDRRQKRYIVNNDNEIYIKHTACAFPYNFYNVLLRLEWISHSLDPYRNFSFFSFFLKVFGQKKYMYIRKKAK